MARKILECSIKTIDEKSHIRFYTIKDIDADSIKFLADTPKEKKVIPIPKPKETVTKKIKKIIKKKNY